MRVLVVLLALLVSARAMADDFPVVPGLRFTYAMPQGFCAFDPGRSDGERVMTGEFEASLGDLLRPVAVLTECTFLTALRGGASVDTLPTRGLAVLLPLREGAPQQAPISRAEFLSKSVPKLKEELLPPLQRAKLDIVGIFEEPEAFYVVFKAGQPGLGIVAVTLIQGYQVATLGLDLRAETTEEAFFAEVRAFVRDMIERNDPGGESRNPYLWLGVDWDRIAPYVPILLAVGFVYWWRGRRMRQRRSS